MPDTHLVTNQVTKVVIHPFEVVKIKHGQPIATRSTGHTPIGMVI